MATQTDRGIEMESNIDNKQKGLVDGVLCHRAIHQIDTFNLKFSDSRHTDTLGNSISLIGPFC